MKMLFKNWKFSIFALILIVVLNIVFLCQPVFGTYRGVEKYENYGASFNIELKFSNGFVSMSEKRNYPGDIYYQYNIGTYERYGDKIFCIVHRVNDPSSSHIYLDERSYTRDSVFSLSSGEGEYTSIGAVVLQIAYSIAEIVFLIRFVSQFRDRNIIKKESDD